MIKASIDRHSYRLLQYILYTLIMTVIDACAKSSDHKFKITERVYTIGNVAEVAAIDVAVWQPGSCVLVKSEYEIRIQTD